MSAHGGAVERTPDLFVAPFHELDEAARAIDRLLERLACAATFSSDCGGDQRMQLAHAFCDRVWREVPVEGGAQVFPVARHVDFVVEQLSNQRPLSADARM